MELCRVRDGVRVIEAEGVGGGVWVLDAVSVCPVLDAVTSRDRDVVPDSELVLVSENELV